jgi:hypothetical protein
VNFAEIAGHVGADIQTGKMFKSPVATANCKIQYQRLQSVAQETVIILL